MSSASIQSKVEILRAKIDQRKAAEKKAFDTSVKLIEADTVDEETLIKSAILIDQERYRGINEDRSLRQICGYPLCSASLPEDRPKHQYFIDVKVNRVIDTTERRLFCSTFCYKASKYYERQIPQSPVWARDEYQENALPKIELLTRETMHKETTDKSTVISHAVSTHVIPRRRPSTSSSSSSSDEEFEQLQLVREQYYKSRAASMKKPNLVENKLRQTLLPEAIRTNNITIDFVITCLYEWMTPNTREYLKQSNDRLAASTIDPIDPTRYQQLVRRLDVDDMMNSNGSRAEKPLPTLEQIRENSGQGQYAIKVKEFLFGKTPTEDSSASASATIVLPPVDAYSQQTIRLSIVSEKIMTCFKQIFSDRIETKLIRDLRSGLSELLVTFSFKSDNITLKPNEWTIMTLLLSFLLAIRLPNLESNLNESKIVHSLLTAIGISPDMILSTTKYLVEHPLEELPPAASQTTNMILIQRTGQTAFKDLIESEVINIEKLKQYAQKKSIVAELKPLCWKLLLGIKSPFRAIRQYVDEANCHIYQRLHSTLISCQIIQTTTPLSQQFLAMYLLDSHNLKLSDQLLKEHESFLSIANVICSFLDHDNTQAVDVTTECWLMTCAIYERFLHFSRRITLIRYHVNRIAQQEFVHESKLLLHLNSYNIFVCIPEQWIKDGFQLIRDDISLSNIWEKFFAGCEYIFVFLIVHILHHCRQKLLSFYTTKEISQYLLDLKIDDQASCEHIVLASIGSWKKHGGSLLDLPVINN